MSEGLPATTLVVFGITGDLSRRYLLPALAEICRSSEVMARLRIIGVSRHDITAADVLKDETANLAEQLQTFKMDYSQPADYERLKEKLRQLACEQAIFYFAVPPASVAGIIAGLGQAGLNTPNFRLLMEKPFGTDYQSAKALIDQTNQYYKEEQIYRIDHYLAKEMAQNIAVFLDSNALFRGVWNNQFIAKIEIIAAESIGMEGRGRFYEQTGALRDYESHLMMLTALILMEPCPDVLDMSMMRKRRLAVLEQLGYKSGSAVFGQYRGYPNEVGNPASKVETFVALQLESNDPKWQGVPISLATGKRLDQKLTEIRVSFKKSQDSQTNSLRLRIQPDEAIELDLWVKKPGYEQDIQKLPLDFKYHQYFEKFPNAYEQVIVDAVRGRANLFASSDEVLASWQILQPLLDEKSTLPLKIYEPGSTLEKILN